MAARIVQVETPLAHLVRAMLHPVEATALEVTRITMTPADMGVQAATREDIPVMRTEIVREKETTTHGKNLSLRMNLNLSSQKQSQRPR